MQNIFFIKWGKDFNDNYCYGADIELLSNNRVSYASPLMPTGKIIKTWYSKTQFHAKRNSPMLPLLTQEKEYLIEIVGQFSVSNAVQMAVDLFDSEDQLLDRIYFSDFTGSFVYPEEAASYEVHLLNKNHQKFIFEYLKISEKMSTDTFEQVNNQTMDVISFIKKENKKNIVVVSKDKTQTLNLLLDTNNDCNYHFLLVTAKKDNLIAQLLQFYQIILSNHLEMQDFIIEQGSAYFQIRDEYHYIAALLSSLLPQKVVDGTFEKLSQIELIKQKIWVNYALSKLLLNFT